MENDLLSQLNDEQRAAAACTEGPVMIIAGAGSGKTRTLTYRIAHLIEKGVDPFNILALTFTNKAAKEMKERITKLVGAEARNLWMGTFHSIFSRILRFEAERIGYTRNFTIYDTDDSKSAIKQLLKQMGLDEKAYKPSIVQSRISSAKNGLIDAKHYQEDVQIQQEDSTANRPYMGQVYTLYSQRLRNANAMDFDDLLFNTAVLLRDCPDVLLKYQNRFRYIMVDEYQDTNYAQYLIVKKLAARFQNVCVVGDDAQSIYAFRGANIQNIFNFQKDYPQLHLFKLEQNYRSTKSIVEAANSIITNNKKQIPKEIWTDNEQGERIVLLDCIDERDEGTQVAEGIQASVLNDGLQYKDIAILYRNNVQSRAIEEKLIKHKIPYYIYAGISFYGRKEVKDMLSYMRVVVNNHDDEALVRIINYPARGIGQTTMDKIRLAAADNGVSICTVLENLPTFDLKLNSGTLQRLDGFITMIKMLGSMVATTDAFTLAKKIVYASGVLKALQEDDDPDSANRIENIEELLNGVQNFVEDDEAITPGDDEDGHSLGTLVVDADGQLQQDAPLRTLDQFLQQVLLLTSEDKKNDKDENRVSLMTIHSAKGLEFPFVYVVGMEENLFPSIMSVNSRAELEEERRLFYVAVTRAEKRLVLSHAFSRYQYGNETCPELSRFVDEIDLAYISRSKARSRYPQPGTNPFARLPLREHKSAAAPRSDPPKGYTPLKKKLQNTATSPTISNTPAEISAIQPGMLVHHFKFGNGRVRSIEGSGDSTKAIVSFDQVGEKTLVLKFAKLSIVE